MHSTAVIYILLGASGSARISFRAFKEGNRKVDIFPGWPSSSHTSVLPEKHFPRQEKLNTARLPHLGIVFITFSPPHPPSLFFFFV